jgi:glycine/D-amino acid oxidase-like deaminating enzyme/nitrite reductase/ring-hydroxylating ferredoxin subunit
MRTGTGSLWEAGAELPTHPTLDRDARADVVVIGGGITGLTLGLRLAQAGRRVVVLERNRIGTGTTARTTAHLTASLDVEYEALVSRFGEEAARGVVASTLEAIDEIEALAEGGCGFRRLPGYRFTERAEHAKRLEREAELARALGLDARLVEAVPLPFPSACAIRFERQAEIHPLDYLRLLAELLSAAGGTIRENSPVVEVTDEGVRVAHGPRVRAQAVVDASHTPVGLVASIQTRVTAFTSYVLAARLEEPAEPALFWDTEDPYHYVRRLGEASILVGGEDHRTGREEEPAARLARLEEWTRKRFPVRSVESGWSHELFEPADGLPYIGALPGSRSRFVAAGYSGTGLTFGTVAARVLCDLLTAGASPWEALYSPRRVKPLAAVRPVAEETLRIGWRFVADRIAGLASREEPLAPDSGRIERIGGRPRAVYRDVRGDLHLLSPRCTHMGCIVAWNDLEKTWDCPCHGGRFHPTGKPLYGPPTRSLEHEPDADPTAE